MCLCTGASEFSFNPCPISSKDGEYPFSVTNREMKSYTSRCLRVMAMPPLMANIRRKSKQELHPAPASERKMELRRWIGKWIGNMWGTPPAAPKVSGRNPSRARETFPHLVTPICQHSDYVLLKGKTNVIVHALRSDPS